MAIVTPFIPERVGRGAHCSTQVIRQYNIKPLFTICAVSPINTTENFSKTRNKHSNTQAGPEIEPETSCSAVALAITRPTKQILFKCCKCVYKHIISHTLDTQIRNNLWISQRVAP
ncbi:hypothetical protein SFRURICE_015699 [Spodoptera frugiperda]|nr:hypothetical protein SFRURICE_015699 [Spodoptera frugiperda]